MDEGSVLQKGHEKPQQKAPADVDDEGAVGETCSEPLCGPFCYQIAAISAENASKTNCKILHSLPSLLNLSLYWKLSDQRT